MFSAVHKHFFRLSKNIITEHFFTWTAFTSVEYWQRTKYFFRKCSVESASFSQRL